MAVSSRETAIIKNSLITLLQAIKGRRTTVDLRREDSVEGLLVDVDAYMNLTMKQVRLVSAIAGRPDCYLDQMFIQGREVRYIHIPDDMDIIDSIQSELHAKKNYMLKQKTELERLTKKKLKKGQKESLLREKKETAAANAAAMASTSSYQQ